MYNIYSILSGQKIDTANKLPEANYKAAMFLADGLEVVITEVYPDGEHSVSAWYENGQ